MKFVKEFRQRARKLFFPACLLFLFVYTYYQMFTSSGGLMVWYDLKNQVLQIETQNNALQEQVELTEDKILRLKGDNLDADFVDEQIRRNLPKMHENEKVIFLD